MSLTVLFTAWCVWCVVLVWAAAAIIRRLLRDRARFRRWGNRPSVRLLGHPLIAVAAFGAITLDFYLLPGQSDAGWWRDSVLFGGGQPRTGKGYFLTELYRDQSRTIHAAFGRVFPHRQRLCTVALRCPEQTGFWVPTSERRFYSIVWSAFPPKQQPGSAALNPAEKQEAESAIADYFDSLPRDFFPGFSKGLRAGKQPDTALLWVGVLHTSITGFIAIAALGSVAAMPAWFVHRRREIRALPECHRCRYPLEGLEERVCPECGAVCG